MNYEPVLKFWFVDTDRKNHFKSSPAFDADIRARFEDISVDQAALAGKGLHPWENEPESALALILVLDQFPRNMYRATPAAFAWDDLALSAAKRMVENGFDFKTPQNQRSFIYMPFMHSENIEDQMKCVELVDQRINDDSTLFHAKSHLKVIESFGRFPHRNEILGRTSTPDEFNFLKNDGYTP